MNSFEMKKCALKLGYQLPGAENDQSELGGLGDKKVNVFTRKPAYHFGWDWGPRLVSNGIWQEIVLKAWDKAKIVCYRFSRLRYKLVREEYNC